jgi:FkbM family methyltransferase
LLISADILKSKFGVNPTGILHVGAHLGEEGKLYVNTGWSCEIIWVEGQKKLADALRGRLPARNKVIHAIVWDSNGTKLDFKVTNNSQSSSLYDFGTHKLDYPDILVTKIKKVTTSRLDSFIKYSDKIDLLVLDIQGAELRAIIGLGEHIRRVKYIYSEVNKREVYIGCPNVKNLDNYLINFGFKRIATKWVIGAGWGDALWIKADLIDGYWFNIYMFKFKELQNLISVVIKPTFTIRKLKLNLKKFKNSL